MVSLIVFWSWITGGVVPAAGGSGNLIEKADPAGDAGWGMDPNG